MNEIFRALTAHALVAGVFCAVVWKISGVEATMYAAWGSALGFLPTIGFAFLLGQNLSEESSKKGVALVIAGSVLRYGIFLLLLALLVFKNFQVPFVFIGGLLIWIPSSAVIALIVRRTTLK